ncbi:MULTISPECIES: YqgQ family protein [unclassified Virgibacillus]|uniref:YqgQ family protein n=1 Tax=unclassified Virgibacillus TaxID=2620237 RepID=UPI0024DEECBF|nr:YqgQ family protein [Virgibacillus sp. LDC-1]
MQTVFDVQQVLKRFGIFIYVGDRLADIELMELELYELFKSGFISSVEYQQCTLVLKKEARQIQGEKRGRTL